MKRTIVIMFLLSMSIIGACSDNGKNQDHISVAQSSKENNVASIEALQHIKDELNTAIPIKMPTMLPVAEDAFLTATTRAEENQIEIIFYESKEDLPINDLRLKDSATVIGRLLVKQYQSAEGASAQIAYNDFSQNGGQEVDLGYSIKGYQDAGAGALWTGWNEGRWALATHTRTDNPEAGVQLAKQVVEYLESHMLPIPKQYGMAQLDVYQSGNLIVWQDERLVYTLDSIQDPLQALEIAMAFYQ
ncbi:hypothetical protein I6G82_20990 [Lysinibacillus macroides]|uniref:Lipoprotein n=1 Tax=Lysinibacillus macroides TaxID=33935 RepID=A0A0M9DH68_9BACI|nr:hypothetical protein [Lysinibacillus macroides]KOY80336.1 hypothetical protein ADM90_21075 [Lysinibacillus macroides]QPR67646.1 hypothetical protein I6G82_20990 [Lysinibacillus macroides]